MFAKKFFFTILFLMLLASYVYAKTIDQDRKRPSDATIAGISCLNDDVFFDGLCRAPQYFQRFVAPGFELSSVSGCGVRPTRHKDQSACGATIVLTERNSDLTTRTITISAMTPLQLINSLSRRPAIPRTETFRPTNYPKRNGKAVLAQTITHVQQEAGGSRLIETTQSLLGDGGKMIEVMTRDMFLNAVTDGAALQDYNVTGTICTLGDMDTLFAAISGSPDCSCRDEGRCGLTGFSSTGLAVKADRAGYSYCSKTSRYVESLNGILQSELDLLFQPKPRRLFGNRLVTDRPRKTDSLLADRRCYSISGMAYNGLLQAQNATGTPSSTSCGPKIATAFDVEAMLCNIGAGSVSLGAGIVGSGYEIGLDQTIDGESLNIKNIVLNIAENTSFAYEYLGEICPSTQFNAASAEVVQSMCAGGGGGGRCAGTHDLIPISVTLSDGRTCDATATLECTEPPGGGVDLLDVQCECTPSNANIDFQSCR